MSCILLGHRNLGGFNLLNDYYEKVISNPKFERYKKIIQFGAKNGQSLAMHVENMIGVMDSIKNIFHLSTIEQKVLMTAITIHDINKVPDYNDRKSYLDIISEKDKEGNYINLITECELIGINDFFPEYRDYLNDIREIIGRHSGFLNSFGDNLINKNNGKLERDSIEKLVLFIRAVDGLELSKTLYEKEKKRQFLNNVNIVARKYGKQYEIVTHRIVDDRGILTNFIHNCTVTYLNTLGLIPFAYYKEGVAYLVDKDIEINLEKEVLFESIITHIKEKILSDFRVFIKASQSGIKVDEKCLENTSIDEIIYEIKNKASTSKEAKLEKKNKVIMDVYEKYKDFYDEEKFLELTYELNSLEKKLLVEENKKNLISLEKEKIEKERALNIQIASKKMAELIKENMLELNANEEVLKFSEFLRGIYNFLNTYVAKKKSDFAWNEFYTLLNVSKEEICYLNLIPSKEALYTRPYILGQLLFDKYEDDDDFIKKIIVYFKDKIKLENMENNSWNEFKVYMKKNILFSFENTSIKNFKYALEVYSDKKISKCALCSNEFSASDWMANDVPYKIKVQSFSNRIVAGKREPKRQICFVCKIEYLLHKASYISSGEVSRKYISLLSRNFLTKAYINSVKKELKDFNDKEVNSLYFNSYKTFMKGVEKNTNSLVPIIDENKGINGIAIAKYSEVYGNYFIMPIHFKTENTNREIWLQSLLQALVFNQYFNMKVIVSNFPMALFDSDDIDEIYIGDTPVVYKRLFDKKWTREQCLKTIDLFINMFFIGEKLNKKVDKIYEFIYKSLVKLNNSNLDFLHYVYKKIKEPISSDLIILIKDYIENILKYIKEEDEIMEGIKLMAEFAYKNNLFGTLGGGYIKDNSILKPLNIIFDNYERNIDIFNENELKALSKREIQKYFERTSGKYYGEKKIKNIEAYVDLFDDKLLNKKFDKNINKLISKKKEILSIYSYYFRVEIAKNKEEENKNE